jgi:hypothetical protein
LSSEWFLCIFPEAEPDEFPGGPKDKSILEMYGGHMVRYIFEGYVTLYLNFYDSANFFIV